MNNVIKKLKITSILSLLIYIAGHHNIANADVGLPDTPLFLGNSVQPNIFFGIDDSGSMAFGFLVESVTSGRFDLGGNTQYRIVLPFAQLSSHEDDIVPSEAFLTRVINEPTGTNIFTAARKAQAAADLLEVWRAWNSSHNALYYDPAVTYIPWQFGEDIDGNAFTNASPMAARIDPYKPADGTVDLTTDLAEYQSDWQGRFWNNSSSGGEVEGRIDGYYPAS